MIKKILVASGIGDFSWLWSKVITTGDQFDINYAGGNPDRMQAFLKLLPKDKVVGFRADPRYATRWNDKNILEAFPRNGFADVVNVKSYSELNDTEMKFIECNSLLEAGIRLETWMHSEIPNVDFHYRINGVLDKCIKNDCFIVNFSSYGTKKEWGYYEIEDSIDIVKFVQKKTGWMPIFIGGSYDDYTTDICNGMIEQGLPAINLVGKTPELVEVLALIQQSQCYFGACSGLMAIANVLYVPTVVYYPPFPKPPGRKLSGMWHDPNVLHVGMFWEGKEHDKRVLNDVLDIVMNEEHRVEYSISNA
jgi:hypothetical protein